ncbi:MAG TPA: DUF1996 domain-containing protein [Spirillospora sp.]
MGIKKRKPFAVMIPALALAASACQVTPGTAAPQPGQTTPAAGSDLDGGGQLDDVKNPGRPGGGPGGGDQGNGQGNDQGDGDGQGQGGGGQNDGGQNGGDDQGNGGGRGDGNGQGNDQGNGGDGGQQVEIPELRADQYVPIQRAPRVREPRVTRRGSRGVFSVDCGTNEGQQHSNPDNVVAAPGVVNGAHHIHDYVGNLDTDAFSTDETLAAADTTCENGDKSTYFWPVLRDRNGEDNSDRAEQSRADGNIGSIIEPSEVRLEFRGNPRSTVTAMPRFLRMATGDAKAVTNGLANANARWTCTGFEDRAFTDKYPLCPEGSRLVRILDFAGCWDGQNTDSANHRDHVAFADERTGQCPQGFQAIPQLRMTLVYEVNPEPLAFALDSFPESGHDPVTDHGDFINVMDDGLMQQVVNTINGRKGRGGGQDGGQGDGGQGAGGQDGGQGDGGQDGGQGDGGQGQPTEEPANPSQEPAPPAQQQPTTRSKHH